MSAPHGPRLSPESLVLAQGELLSAGRARPFRLVVGPGLIMRAPSVAREADPRIEVAMDVDLPWEGWRLEDA